MSKPRRFRRRDLTPEEEREFERIRLRTAHLVGGTGLRGLDADGIVEEVLAEWLARVCRLVYVCVTDGTCKRGKKQ